MGKIEAPTVPDTFAPGGEGVHCQKCGHEADGRFPGRVSEWLRTTLGLRPAKIRCATYHRETAMNDPEYCECDALIHSSVKATEPHFLDEY